MKKTNYYKLSVEAVLSNSLRRFRRMLKKALMNVRPREDFNPDEWFFSNVETAKFIGCSVRTVRRMRAQGKIPCIQHKNVCLFRIAAVLNAIANDDSLSMLFTRKRPARRPKKAPVARYSSTLRKGWLWIAVRFLRCDMTIVVNPKEWNSDERIAELVKQVISSRITSKTFKTFTREKNH
jgi:hypothetical protein